MTLEAEYRQVVIDRNWWGNFPDPQDLVGKEFPDTSDIYRLVPVCARIALHIAGELPQISFSREKKVFGDFEYILLNPELLYLQLPDSIRMSVFFGNFVHQLGHFVYSRHDFPPGSYTYEQACFIHLLEDRRVESRLVQAYPGYYDYLYAARKLVFAQALRNAGNDLRFSDLGSVRYNYIATRILYPGLFDYDYFAGKFDIHRSRLRRIDELLDGIGEYRELTPERMLELGKRLAVECGSEPKVEDPMFNYYSKVMKNLPFDTEGQQVNIDVKIFDDLFQDLNRTLDLDSTQVIGESGGGSGFKSPAGGVRKEMVESEAQDGDIIPEVLTEAKALASKIRLNFLTFLAKMNKTCVVYEQDSGELDEEELYQVSFNSNIFMEELSAPSAALEIIILLDLSGSMVEHEKLRMQMTLSIALALAFEGNPNVRFSIYGHRVNRGRVEIVRYHEAGGRFHLKRLFAQEGFYMNADGVALEYCLQKFKTGTSNKLIFMISDGRPTVAYGGTDPRTHVRETVRLAKRRGIEVLSIGISNFDQGDMYDEFIPYSGADVTVKLVQWLRRKFSSIADGATF